MTFAARIAFRVRRPRQYVRHLVRFSAPARYVSRLRAFLPDVGWFPRIVMCETGQAYGGGEEGGWFYSYGNPVSQSWRMPLPLAVFLCDRIEMDEPDSARGWYFPPFNGCGDPDAGCHHDDGLKPYVMGKVGAWPDNTPHYE